ncbi:MAG: Flp family type IVb pilin [Candidatus Eisenbacteria bacterium]
MRTLVRIMRNLFSREAGQTLTEYGLLLFFIAVVAIIAITVLGEQISSIFSNVANSLSGG